MMHALLYICDFAGLQGSEAESSKRHGNVDLDPSREGCWKEDLYLCSERERVLLAALREAVGKARRIGH